MINKVILVGNVGKDPEMRTAGDASVASFTLATSESWKDRSGNRQTQTEWHNIEVWRGLADVVDKYVKKGQMLYLEGKIKQQSWDKQDGSKAYKTIIVVSELKMLGGNGGNQGASQAAPTPEAEGNNGGTDDLPF